MDKQVHNLLTELAATNTEDIEDVLEAIEYFVGWAKNILEDNKEKVNG